VRVGTSSSFQDAARRAPGLTPATRRNIATDEARFFERLGMNDDGTASPSTRVGAAALPKMR